MPILGFFAAWNCAKLPFYWVPWTEEESVAEVHRTEQGPPGPVSESARRTPKITQAARTGNRIDETWGALVRIPRAVVLFGHVSRAAKRHVTNRWCR